MYHALLIQPVYFQHYWYSQCSIQYCVVYITNTASVLTTLLIQPMYSQHYSLSLDTGQFTLLTLMSELLTAGKDIDFFRTNCTIPEANIGENIHICILHFCFHMETPPFFSKLLNCIYLTAQNYSLSVFSDNTVKTSLWRTLRADISIVLPTEVPFKPITTKTNPS